MSQTTELSPTECRKVQGLFKALIKSDFPVLFKVEFSSRTFQESPQALYSSTSQTCVNPVNRTFHLFKLFL